MENPRSMALVSVTPRFSPLLSSPPTPLLYPLSVSVEGLIEVLAWLIDFFFLPLDYKLMRTKILSDFAHH